MKRLFLIALLLSAPALSQAKLRIFACEPEWAALAHEIAGDKVKTHSGTTALQDPHYIQARPSLIAKVRRADLVVCSGAQLEIGWLPMLLRKANNSRAQPGARGFMYASDFVRRLEIPSSVDRIQGDMHPQGNPHVQTNPHNIARIAKALAERMQELDAGNADAYQAGLDDFLKRWNAAMLRWEQRAGPLRGKRVITHHKSWVYLEDWLGLREVANLEPKPGIPPTASHLSALLNQLGSDGKGADLIIRTAYQDSKPSQWLSQRTKIPETMLPFTVGGSDHAQDLFSLFDDTLDRLLGTLQ